LPEQAEAKSASIAVSAPTERLMIFVDGQNLLYGCNSYEQGFKWDIDAFIGLLTNLEPNRKLVQPYYYASIAPIDRNRVDDEGNPIDDEARYRKQQMFYNVVRQKFKTEIKTTQIQSVHCPNCKTSFKKPKEKGVDVALAADLLTFGLTNDYDVAILVSGDADYLPALKKLAERKPNLKLEIAQFSGQVGHEFRDAGFKFHRLEQYAESFRLQRTQA
jgi:uncharacterized LabA/DUF88 family protein